jgi:soluble lytic murein transglycosylase-like protein
MSPGTAAFTSGGLGDVPGVPVSYATCVAQRESSDNPRAVNSIPGYVGNGGGAYGFLTSTWQGMGAITAGYAQPFDAPVAVQKAAFAALYKQDGTSPWSPSDHC